MCRNHEHGERRCRCCDPEARRAARREARMRERGLEAEPDREFCAATVAERAAMADEYPEAAFDPSPTVRSAAARGSLTEEAEDVLAGDETPRVRRSLASNPSCSPETLETLSMDEDAGVREAVAKHRSTPPGALEVMASELDRKRDLAIARALASNPHTPRRALEGWLEDGTGGWKTLARAALRDRTEAVAGAVLDGAERAGMAIDGARTAAADELDEVLGKAAANRAQVA